MDKNTSGSAPTTESNITRTAVSKYEPKGKVETLEDIK
jgi:hypothetical protein